MTNAAKSLLIIFAALALSSCTYAVQGTPTYDASGVKRLSELPSHGNFKNLGLHAWGFYRPSFSEPTLADVWDAISAEVTALGGNACVVRYEKVGWLTARTIEVTCEVLRLN